MSRVVRLATRGSLLARTQAGMVADALRARGCEVELVCIRTEGDVSMRPLSEFGGVGVFAAAVRTALLDGVCDLAVHSFKDLPTGVVEGLEVAAVPERESAADVLVSRDGLSLAELPHGARVGTGSPRRRAQMLTRRPDIECVDIRGNVDTRLRFVEDGELDAVVLAESGLVRVGRAGVITERLGFIPAPAQGALAIETRCGAVNGDGVFATALRSLDHEVSHAAVVAERAVLATLQAGCAAPVGAHAVAGSEGLVLRGVVVSTDGSRRVESDASGSDPAELGRIVAEAMLAGGAAGIADLGANRVRR